MADPTSVNNQITDAVTSTGDEVPGKAAVEKGTEGDSDRETSTTKSVASLVVDDGTDSKS